MLNLQSRYIATIYKEILAHKTVKQIHKELYDMTINKKSPLLITALKITNKAKKLDKGKGEYYGPEGLVILADALINLFNKDKIIEKTTIAINKELRELESKDKEKVMKDMLENSRINAKIFFVASMHDDCAEDHLDYQGKVYVDRYWWQITHGDKEVEQYIKSNNIRTIQWVTGKPVYFVTRPHCRHYFVQKDIESILSGKFYTPHRKVGARSEIQTPATRNVEYYAHKLKIYEEMYKQYPTRKLRDLIVKYKAILKKWKDLR